MGPKTLFTFPKNYALTIRSGSRARSRVRHSVPRCVAFRKRQDTTWRKKSHALEWAGGQGFFKCKWETQFSSFRNMYLPLDLLQLQWSLWQPLGLVVQFTCFVFWFSLFFLSSCFRKCKLLWLFWTMTRLARTMPLAKCLWATIALVQSCDIGQTCWPTQGDPLHSGIPYSKRKR